MFWSAVSALGLGVGAYVVINDNNVKTRRDEILGENTRRPLKEWPMYLGSKIVSKNLIKKLQTINVSVEKYTMETLIFTFGMPVLVAVAMQSPFMAFVFGFLGYGLSYIRYLSLYEKWKQEVISSIPDLVTYLKIRLKTGDTVSKAISNVLPMLKGSMAAEWAQVVALHGSGYPLDKALSSFMERLNDRDLTAVLLRLIAYSKEGLAGEPFGDLTEHMNHLAAIKKKYELKKATTPMTIYAGISLIIAIIVGMVPYFYQMFMGMFGNMAMPF